MCPRACLPQLRAIRHLCSGLETTAKMISLFFAHGRDSISRAVRRLASPYRRGVASLAGRGARGGPGGHCILPTPHPLACPSSHLIATKTIIAGSSLGNHFPPRVVKTDRFLPSAGPDSSSPHTHYTLHCCHLICILRPRSSFRLRTPRPPTTLRLLRKRASPAPLIDRSSLSPSVRLVVS